MKILIIDDEIAALTKMKALLSGYGECTMTTNPKQAVQFFKNAITGGVPFNFIAIDIGLDLLETFNSIETKAKIKTSTKIIVTATGTKDNLQKAYINGCDGFLVKPVKRDTLREKMMSLGIVTTENLQE